MHSAFLPLYESKKRYFLLTGGRGSLKSSNVQEFAIKLMHQPGEGILLTRYTMESAQKSIIPEFKIVLERLAKKGEVIQDEFDITANKAINKKTGSFIYFSGIKVNSKDQTAKLKSLAGVTCWIIEEGEDFNDKKKFDTIDDSIRTSTTQNRIIWIQNPTTKEHFIYPEFIEPKSKQIDIDGYKVTVSDMDNVEHIHTTYHIGQEYLSEDWLAKADKYKEKAEASEDKHKSHYYFNYIGGWLEKAEGVIFPIWERGEMDLSLPYGYGLDYGYFPDPNAMVKVAVDRKRKILYVEEKLYKTEQGVQEVITAVKARIDKPRDLIVTDYEKRTTAELKKARLNAKLADKGPDSVINGIRAISDYKIVVCGDSPNLIKELNNYVWNDKKASIPKDAWNHLIDAIRYIFKELSSKGNSRFIANLK